DRDSLVAVAWRAHLGECVFDFDGGYIVTVASGEGMGRSAAAQLLHASEVGFWPGLPLQMASLMQTVPDIDGTEVILLRAQRTSTRPRRPARRLFFCFGYLGSKPALGRGVGIAGRAPRPPSFPQHALLEGSAGKSGPSVWAAVSLKLSA